MGFETYCAICGAPCNNDGAYWVGKGKYAREALFKQLKLNKKAQQSFTMYASMQAQPELCELLKLPRDIIDKCLKPLGKKYNWLAKCLYFGGGKNIKVIPQDSWEGEFVDAEGEEYLANNNIAHRDCYTALKTKFGPFKWSVQKINFGPIAKYMTQDIMWDNWMDKIPYTIESPLHCVRNKERILGLKHLISPIIAQSRRANRPSPPESAKLFAGQKRKGGDGNLWVSVANAKGIYQWRKVK